VEISNGVFYWILCKTNQRFTGRKTNGYGLYVHQGEEGVIIQK
jgi:hypothetical protein